MDTFKDKQILDELDANGAAPWCLWKRNHQSARNPALEEMAKR